MQPAALKDFPFATSPAGDIAGNGSQSAALFPEEKPFIAAKDYTLNRKCMISPSFTRYSFPSMRSLPASRAPASDLYCTKSL